MCSKRLYQNKKTTASHVEVQSVSFYRDKKHVDMSHVMLFYRDKMQLRAIQTRYSHFYREKKGRCGTSAS